MVLSFARLAKPHTNLRGLWQLYNFCKSGRRHTCCHAVTIFILLGSWLGLAAVVARPMRRATVTFPRPRPPSLKHSPTARVLWGKKVGSLRSASPPTGELLISLPVEQQLQELKPNGSNSGNRKIPTLSSCRQGRRESPPVDGVSTQRSGRWASFPPPVDSLRVRRASESMRQAAP